MPTESSSKSSLGLRKRCAKMPKRFIPPMACSTKMRTWLTAWFSARCAAVKAGFGFLTLTRFLVRYLNQIAYKAELAGTKPHVKGRSNHHHNIVFVHQMVTNQHPLQHAPVDTGREKVLHRAIPGPVQNTCICPAWHIHAYWTYPNIDPAYSRRHRKLTEFSGWQKKHKKYRLQPELLPHTRGPYTRRGIFGG